MTLLLFIFACALGFANCAHFGLRVPPLVPVTHTPHSPVTKIVGGEAAQVDQFPHQVSLQWKKSKTSEYNHFCGGSILNEQWILTAGHCVLAVPFNQGVFAVKAGKYNLNLHEKNEQCSEVEQSFVHEEYIGEVAPFDIALLKLKSPLTFNKHVSPVKLPSVNAETDGEVILSGWGSTSMTSKPEYPSILQTVKLYTIDIKRCNASIESMSWPSPLHETNLCTGPIEGGYSACSGDSGGPLIREIDGTSELVGVVSWGMLPCGIPNAPSIFVKVSAFITWIEKTMQK